MSTSRRPTGTTRGSFGTRSTTVRPSLRVARGRDDARRLVEQQVREPLQRDLAAVDLDAVGLLDEGVELARLAVDADAAGLDQVVGLAARGDAGAGEIGVQAHE